MCRILSSADHHSFTSYFLIQIPFISFSSLIVVARTSKAMLNKSGKRGHPCVFLTLEEMLSAFHCWIWCYLWVCHIWPLLCSLYAHFWEGFYVTLQWIKGFPGGAVGQNSPASSRDARGTSLAPGLGRCLRVGNGNLLQYPRLENVMGRGVWWATAHGLQRVGSDWAYMHASQLSNFMELVVLIVNILIKGKV